MADGRASTDVDVPDHRAALAYISCRNTEHTGPFFPPFIDPLFFFVRLLTSVSVAFILTQTVLRLDASVTSVQQLASLVSNALSTPLEPSCCWLPKTQPQTRKDYLLSTYECQPCELVEVQ